MAIFKRNKLSLELAAVSDKTDRTAAELEVVKRRQKDIERRLAYLNQELEVQQRKLR